MKRLLDKLFNKHDNPHKGTEPAMSSEKSSLPPLPETPWPLRFDSFNFGADFYHTLKCSIIFNNYQHSTRLDRPSGEPYSEDWKDHWEASHIISQEKVFPPPVEIRWTALDGIERHATVDLKAIFPNREILHNVPREDVPETWGYSPYSRMAEILLEVNDRTINVYMRALVLTKHLENPSDPDSKIMRNELVLAWTKTY